MLLSMKPFVVDPAKHANMVLYFLLGTFMWFQLPHGVVHEQIMVSASVVADKHGC